jgi:hypothetical protein
MSAQVTHPRAAGGPKGFDCSSMKVLYVKLGLERRETVTVPIYCWLFKERKNVCPGNERTVEYNFT